MPTSSTIFVAIASYCDPECPATVQDLFARAEHPERVSVGLCWQHKDPDDLPRGAPEEHAVRVRSEVVHVRESHGACWAKGRAHGLRRDERFVLQVDAHMRFHRGWDTALIEMLARCPSERPVLSTYPAPYEPGAALVCDTAHLCPSRFDDDRILTFIGYNYALEAPRPGAFLAGGYIFAEGAFFDAVPYDPRLYFIGEEATLAARAWTRGWDPFSPDACLVHHLYQRPGMPRHWEDHADWVERNRRSLARVRALLGTEPSDDPEVTAGLAGVFGLGRARTLADFEAYSGVDFRARTIREDAKLGTFGAAGARGAP